MVSLVVTVRNNAKTQAEGSVHVVGVGYVRAHYRRDPWCVVQNQSTGSSVPHQRHTNQRLAALRQTLAVLIIPTQL